MPPMKANTGLRDSTVSLDLLMGLDRSWHILLGALLVLSYSLCVAWHGGNATHEASMLKFHQVFHVLECCLQHSERSF